MPLLSVQTRRLKYEIPISGKFTIIRGDSGTGKTTLIETLGSDKAKISFQLPVKRLEPEGYGSIIRNKTPTLYFCDEDVEFIKSKEFLDVAKNSNHLFLFVSRDPVFDDIANTWNLNA